MVLNKKDACVWGGGGGLFTLVYEQKNVMAFII